MNERFFTLNEEKQNKIINAAYKVFACNDYRKAPMSEIAEEGRISKALLFHYFGNKIGLYMFLWEKAAALSAETQRARQVYETRDFFEMLSRGLVSKCDLMRRHPYMSLFCIKAYYEEDAEVRARIQRSFQNAADQAFALIADRVDASVIRQGFTLEEVYKEILYASDGYMLEQYRMGSPDPDRMQREYGEMIRFWRKALGEEKEKTT